MKNEEVLWWQWNLKVPQFTKKIKLVGGGGGLSVIIRVDTKIFNFYPALYSTFLLKVLSTILKDYFHSHLTAYPCHHSKSRNKWKPRKNLEKNIFRSMESAILIKIDVPQRRRLANDLSDQLSPLPHPHTHPQNPLPPRWKTERFSEVQVNCKAKII